MTRKYCDFCGGEVASPVNREFHKYIAITVDTAESKCLAGVFTLTLDNSCRNLDVCQGCISDLFVHGNERPEVVTAPDTLETLFCRD